MKSLLSRLRFILPAIALMCGGCGGENQGSVSSGVSLNTRFHNALKITNAESRAKTLIQIALSQERAGDLGGAQTSAEEAEKACLQIEDALGRVSAYNRLADLQGRLRMTSQAKRSASRVLESVNDVSDVESRVSALASVALTYGRYLKRNDASRSQLKQAEALLDQQANPTAKTRGLARLAIVHHRLSSSDERDRLMTQATELAESIRDDRQRCDALVAIASSLTRTERKEQALEKFDQALLAADQITDAVSKAHALVELGQALSSVDRGKAQVVLGMAESVSDTIQDRGFQREVIEKIVAARSGK